MSHDNGHIYIDTSVTPNIGVSIYDVQTVLKDSHRDLGSLCISNKINKWAKYKPIRLATLGIPTAQELQSALFGLNHPNEKEVISGIAQDSDAYTYLKPQGGVLGNNFSPYRLLDFNGYYHGSLQPIQNFTMDDINIAEEGDTFEILLQKNIDSDGSMTLSDIFSALGLNDYYLAIGFKRGSSLFYRTSSLTLGWWAGNTQTQSPLGVTFNATDAPFVNIGSSTVSENFYIAAAQNRYSIYDSTAPQSQVFYALPFDAVSQGYGTVNIKNDLRLTFFFEKIGDRSPEGFTYNTFGTGVDPYIGQTGSSYYDIGFSNTRGTLSLGFRITNGNNTTMRVKIPSIKVQFSKNGVDWSNPTGDVSPTSVWASASASTTYSRQSHLVTDSINISANSTVYVTMYCEGILVSGTSAQSVTAGSARPRIELHYDGGSDMLPSVTYIGLQFNNN